MNDYFEKCDAEEDIPSFNKKKAKWYPYRDSSAAKSFPIDKTKKIFCLVCGKLLVNFYGLKLHLTSSMHKSNYLPLKKISRVDFKFTCKLPYRLITIIN